MIKVAAIHFHQGILSSRKVLEAAIPNTGTSNAQGATNAAV